MDRVDFGFWKQSKGGEQRKFRSRQNQVTGYALFGGRGADPVFAPASGGIFRAVGQSPSGGKTKMEKERARFGEQME